MTLTLGSIIIDNHTFRPETRPSRKPVGRQVVFSGVRPPVCRTHRYLPHNSLPSKVSCRKDFLYFSLIYDTSGHSIYRRLTQSKCQYISWVPWRYLLSIVLGSHTSSGETCVSGNFSYELLNDDHSPPRRTNEGKVWMSIRHLLMYLTSSVTGVTFYWISVRWLDSLVLNETSLHQS